MTNIIEWQPSFDPETEPCVSIALQDEDSAAVVAFGGWFACRLPERPADNAMLMHDCCSPCLLAAKAAVAADLMEPWVPSLMEERLERLGEAER